jgi:hypothetical protein
MAGFWAVRVSDNQIIPQNILQGTHHNFVGWQDNTHYLIYDTVKECFAQNLRSVDLITGDASQIAAFCLHTRPAWSPASGAILLSVDSDCDCGMEEGVFLLLPGSTSPIRILEKKAFDLSWLPESSLFFAYPETLLSADGSARYDPPVKGYSYHPAVSKIGNQAWAVIENHRSRVMVQTPNSTWRTILEGSVGAMLWDPIDGKTLLIALETGELYSATAPDFTPRMMGDLMGYYDQATWSSAPYNKTDAV